MSLIAHFAIPSNLIFYDKVDLAYSHMLHMGGWIVLDCQAYISAFMSSNETTQLVQSLYCSTTSSFSILSRVLKLRSLKPILIFENHVRAHSAYSSRSTSYVLLGLHICFSPKHIPPFMEASPNVFFLGALLLIHAWLSPS